MKDLITKENIVEIVQSVLIVILILVGVHENDTEMITAFSSAFLALTGVGKIYKK